MSNCADNSNDIRTLFRRSPDDELLRAKAVQLFASFLSGIWGRVNYHQVNITLQSGGMNNLIFIVKIPEDVILKGSEPRIAVLRIYKNLEESFELRESVITSVLSERKLVPALYGVFAGGRIEEYIPSRILTNKELCSIWIAKEVGRILGRVHSTEMPIDKHYRLTQQCKEMIYKLKETDRWKKSYPMHSNFTKVNKNLFPKKITIDVLLDELNLTLRCLERSGSPLVFSNNDLHEGNLLLRNGFHVTESGITGDRSAVDPILLIDYEYSGYNYRGFDLSHYCVECCQHNENTSYPYYSVIEEQWPSEEIQIAYVSSYLDEARKIGANQGGRVPNCISDLSSDNDTAIRKLMKEIRQFAAFPQLFWGVWSFQLAETTQSEYDYFEYGFDRMALYYKWKPEMLEYLSN